jgi:3',5'-cyclic AMP phosphodiesterase CpdA
MEAWLGEPGPLWRVAVFHHPIFSPATNRDNREFRATWKPVFDRFGIDLVLQGHDHTYARGHVPVRSASGYEEGTLQTLYVTSVSGPKLYDIPDGKFDRYAKDGYVADRQVEATQFFQVISVDGYRLTYEAYSATGELYDKAVVTKQSETGRKRIEQPIFSKQKLSKNLK